jgi:hypothetical protein
VQGLMQRKREESMEAISSASNEELRLMLS